MPYIIESKNCSGCGECLKACPMEAIAPDGRGRFTIDPDGCTDCGTCADICPENAVRGS